MTNKKFCSLLLCLVLCGAGLVRAQGSSPARELLEAAHQASGLFKINSYQMTANVVVNPNSPTPAKGRIAVYRDKDKFRYELALEDYREIKLVLGNKLYVARSLPYPMPGLDLLRELDHAWDKLPDDGDARLSDVQHKKVQHVQAECFDVKTEQRERLCFDPTSKVLLETMDQTQAVEFSDYAPVQHQLFPHKITVLLELPTEERPVITLDHIEVTEAEFQASAFNIPDHAQEFDTCDNLQPAKAVRSPAPEFSRTVQMRNMANPVIHVYAIVDKDGDLQNPLVLSTDVDIRTSTLEALKKWHYTPATCGTTPVSSEQEFEVRLFGNGGDGMRGNSRR